MKDRNEKDYQQEPVAAQSYFYFILAIKITSQKPT
jgi:hypothetical protein